MMQGWIVGGTNYGVQTLSAIKKDIEFWKKYAEETKELFEMIIMKLSQSEYWNKKVPFGFKNFCNCVPQICVTFITDFDIVLGDINKNNVTKRSIKLMQNIARVAIENEERSWRTYNEETFWKEYGENEFTLAEGLYKDGRDFFGTLIDVGNAAKRIEDYMSDENRGIIVQGNMDNSVHNNVSISNVDNSVHNNVTIGNIDNTTHVENLDKSIHIGDRNKIKSSVIGNDNKPSSQSKESKLVWKIIVPIIVSVIAGLAVTAIGIWLGLK